MAVLKNVFNYSPIGTGRLGIQPSPATVAAQPVVTKTRKVVGTPLPTQPAATKATPQPTLKGTARAITAAGARQPAATLAAAQAISRGITPTITTTGIGPGAIGKAVSAFTTPTIRPEAIGKGILSTYLPFLPQLGLLAKTTTQIAQGAIKQLTEAQASIIKEAINTIKSRSVAAGGLMNYLERKVRIGEVLNELAKDWSDDTKQDFAAAFQMDSKKLNVMDSIISISILNDPELEEEILIENTPETTDADLLENRLIVWQYPEPGTPLDPPYIVLVAVEHQEVAQAEDILCSITEELVSYQGYKIPKAAAKKLK